MSSKSLTFTIDCKLKDPVKDREAVPYAMKFEAAGSGRVTISFEGGIGVSPTVLVHSSDLVRIARVLEVFEGQSLSSLTPTPRAFPEEQSPGTGSSPPGFFKS